MRSLLLCITSSLLAGCVARQQQPSSGMPFPLTVTTARHPVVLNYDRCERGERGGTRAVFQLMNVSDAPVRCHWSWTYSFAKQVRGEWRIREDGGCVDPVVHTFELMPGESSHFPTWVDPTAEAVAVGMWFTTSEQNVASAWVWSEPVSVACVAPAQE